jgi:hypothetical protein
LKRAEHCKRINSRAPNRQIKAAIPSGQTGNEGSFSQSKFKRRQANQSIKKGDS